MNSFGKKLEEAREQKSLSIRDVSETLKISEVFLLHIEQDNISAIGLPDIYIRGFVRNYVRFLKLDEDEMISAFDHLKYTENQKTKQNQRESLGHIDVAEVMPSKHSEPVKQERVSKVESDEEKSRAVIYKTGIIVGSAIISIVFLFVLLNALSSSNKEDSQAIARNSASSASANNTTKRIQDERISFIATGDVFLQVTQLPGDQSLYKGALASGDRVELVKDGEIRVQFSEGRNLIIQQGEQQSKIGREGSGWTLIR